MRELKFRVRDKEVKKFDGGLLMDISNWQIYAGNMNYTEHVILMQFTWLLDKNWNEIFEWDLVKCETTYEDWQVIYQNIYVEDITKLSIELFWWSKKFTREVIWNIYENSELLPT